ncbi:hypothetical protein [Escherichia coli]|nr:hypothetical protein [Escherichia coli]
MADFGSTKYNVSFKEWHELLMDYAELRGGSAADADIPANFCLGNRENN